jgi:hypothetical protein
VIAVLAPGTVLEITGFGQLGNGYFWVPVERVSDGLSGWVVDTYLDPTVGPAEEVQAAVIEPTTAGPDEAVNPRYDDPVLRWLPEINAAAAASGLTPAQVAGLVAYMSGGDPSVISALGEVGLLQVKPEEFAAYGVGETLWHDPATNLQIGALVIANGIATTGSFDQALALYFGEGCAPSGACTADYVSGALNSVAQYAGVAGDPAAYGYVPLPAAWQPPAIAPYVGDVPLRFDPALPTGRASPSLRFRPKPRFRSRFRLKSRFRRSRRSSRLWNRNRRPKSDSDWRPGQHPAAVDVVGRTGAIAGGVRRQEERHAGDVVALARSPQHNLLLRLAEVGGIVERTLIHRGQNHAGGDAVDGNPARAEFGRRGPHQIAQPAF